MLRLFSVLVVSPIQFSCLRSEKEIEIHARHLKRKAEGLYHPAIHLKHRPKIAGGGENLPVQILRCLSEWFSVLEDRGTVPGMSITILSCRGRDLQE